MDQRRDPTILHVISSLGHLGGGAERQLLLYLRYRGAGWRHIVTYRQPQTRLREAFEGTGVPTVWLGPGGFFPQLARLVRLARAESVDAIHTHLFEANHLGRVAGKVLGLPVITTITNTLEVADRIASREYTRPYKYRLALALEALTARWGSSRFIAISEAVRDSALRTLGISDQRVHVIYRAIEGEAPRDGAAAQPAVPLAATAPGRPILISTGRLVPHKGQDLLIRMFRLVLERWPGATLQFVGRGRELGALQRLAREQGIADHIQFVTEWVPDINLVLARADLFLFASWFDGFINAFGEAVAAGLPVVAVDLPVLREIAPRSSVLLVQRDEQAFADAVLTVLEDLARFRTTAQEEAVRFRERYSIPRYVNATESLYREAVGAADGRGG